MVQPHLVKKYFLNFFPIVIFVKESEMSKTTFFAIALFVAVAYFFSPMIREASISSIKKEVVITNTTDSQVITEESMEPVIEIVNLKEAEPTVKAAEPFAVTKPSTERKEPTNVEKDSKNHRTIYIVLI
jgi:hypothetical protein